MENSEVTLGGKQWDGELWNDSGRGAVGTTALN